VVAAAVVVSTRALRASRAWRMGFGRVMVGRLRVLRNAWTGGGPSRLEWALANAEKCFKC
jgi:hypothetical protein